MFLFTIILLILCLTSLNESLKGTPQRNKWVELYALGFILFLIAACRVRGYDYESYNDIYDSCQNGNTEGQDLGFAVLCMISPSYRVLLILMAALSTLPLIKLCKKWSPLPVFSLLIIYTVVFFPGAMGQMRQNVATMLILLAYYYKMEHNRLFLIILLFAIVIHTAAVLGLLYFIPIRRRYSFTIYAIGFIVALISAGIIQPVLENYVGLFGVLAQNKFDIYYQTETLRGMSLGLNTAVIIRLIVFILAFRYVKGTRYDNPQFLNIYYLSIVWYIFFGFLPQLGGRGSAYFSILDVFLIPQIIVSLKSYKKWICVVGFLVLSVMRFHQFFADEFSRDSYLPYFN